MKAYVDYMDIEYLCVLQKREDEITRRIAEINKNMSDVKKLFDLYEIFHVCMCIVSLPHFISYQIGKAELNQQLGVLLDLTIKTESNFTLVKAVSSILKRPLIIFPLINTDVFTKFDNNNKVFHVPCVDDRKIWTCGCDEILRFYKLGGKLMMTIQTKFHLA